MNVAKFRTIVVFALLVVWMAIPALACLPNLSMTQDEMACCKKMAGDCQMGIGQHPCCKTSVNRSAPVAKVEHDASQIHAHVVAATLSILPLPARTIDRAYTSQLGLPPPAPPGLNSVLRV